MSATVYTVETNGVKCSFTDRQAAEAFAENNGAVVTEDGGPITAAECYDLARRSWMPAAASEALVRAALTLDAHADLLAALRDVVALADYSVLIDGELQEVQRVFNAARAALAKAKGQS